ncbi:hypothetical protein SERLA73DRAFT_173899 [Serpula lacrymans var. lacrymans S7.3]|uniref:Uncharacterized protein n=2 Tax=Serpula lacrymans var. lacrymans TaxID=341189 RepID=F8PF05_SERL3|nr:uncharacterized protein SERLADRAFT_454833 [Serpula lacrymans var. lacrymans S7.9]EGO04678.1 hypothetical protein SERLA73DRAFT_173899 [Serpula lacrymans var. lacrymans S7.3]EGO30529.1 hypothetical protein SERLADRAFT_454833 [Serpula lacrymans var. lacrymans S7.9]
MRDQAMQDPQQRNPPLCGKTSNSGLNVDQLLKEIRDHGKQGTSSTQEWEDNVKDFFTETLQIDMATYAEPGKLVPPIDTVSMGWQGRIQAQLIW